MLRDVIFKGPYADYLVALPNQRELTVSAPPETVGLDAAATSGSAGRRGRGDVSGGLTREPDRTPAAALGPAGRAVRPGSSSAAVALGGGVQLLAHRELRHDPRLEPGQLPRPSSATAYRTFLGRSLLMAAVVSLICLIYAWPVAYLIAKHGGRYRLLLVLLLAAPFFTGILLRITAMQGLLGPIGLHQHGAGRPSACRRSKPSCTRNVASAIGLVYLWIPFMLVAIYLSLLNFDFELLEVAKMNGARPWQAFFEITWPLNWMGTAIGIILVVIPRSPRP